MSQMIQVHVSIFFYFAEILKMTELRQKYPRILNKLKLRRIVIQEYVSKNC